MNNLKCQYGKVWARQTCLTSNYAHMQILYFRCSSRGTFEPWERMRSQNLSLTQVQIADRQSGLPHTQYFLWIWYNYGSSYDRWAEVGGKEDYARIRAIGGTRSRDCPQARVVISKLAELGIPFRLAYEPISPAWRRNGTYEAGRPRALFCDDAIHARLVNV